MVKTNSSSSFYFVWFEKQNYFEDFDESGGCWAPKTGLQTRGYANDLVNY